MNGYHNEDLGQYNELIETLNQQFLAIEYLHQVPEPSENKSNIAQFLRAKNAIMSKYLIQLNLYILERVKHGTLQEFSIDDILHSKILLQKMQQAQKKLQYQIDKLTKVEQITAQQDEEYEKLTLKPNIDNLIQEQQQQTNKQTKYVPPKLAAALSKEDQIKLRLEKKEEAKRMKQKTKLIQGFMNDLETDQPKEIDERTYQEIYYGRAEDQKLIEKRQHEENQMTRLPVTREEKRKEKKAERLAMTTRLDDFEEFETIKKVVGQKKTIKKSIQHKLKGSMKKFLKNRKKRK